MPAPSPSILVCPICHGQLTTTEQAALRCARDGMQFEKIDDTWRMLTPEAEERLASFITSYETVRRAEGRGSDDPEFYRSLPYPIGLDAKWMRHWQKRAASYESLIANIDANDQLTILDIGAGNGWLSNRLAERGHELIAIDLQTNDFDGLGCQKYYTNNWLSVQAEFDRLPLRDGVADVVVFNASLHYSRSLQDTLTDALRVLKPDGRIVIIDSPMYDAEPSGNRMLLAQGYLGSGYIGFLTPDRIQSAASDLALCIEWSLSKRSFKELVESTVKRLYLRRQPAYMPLLKLSRAADDPGNRSN